MDRPDSDVIENLTRALSRIIPEVMGTGCQLAGMPSERMDRRYSFMFRYHVLRPDGSEVPLLVKIPHEHWMRSLQEAIESSHLQEVVQEEFSGLGAIQEALSTAAGKDLFALCPITVLPEFNALVMQEASIRMLKKYSSSVGIILGNEREWQDFENKLELAGKWLKIVHGYFAGAEDIPLERLDLQASIEVEFEALRHFQAGGLDKPQARFHSLLEELKAEPVRLAWLHNDFQLGNIFVTGDGRVGALDPNWIKDGSIYKDLATVLIDPTTRKMQVLSGGLAFSSVQQKRYQKAFLQGYAGESSTNPALMDLFCATAVLKKWRQDEEELWNVQTGLKTGLKKAASSLVRPVVRAYFYKLMNGYLMRGLEEVGQPPKTAG